MFNIGNISELKVESKVGKLNRNDEEVYKFLSDFNNFSNLLPQDKVKNWNANVDECSFEIENIGQVGLKIIEKEPHSLVKITGSESAKFDFFLWVQLKQIENLDTRIKLTIKAKLNPLVKSAAKKPLQDFIDTLVDQLSKKFS